MRKGLIIFGIIALVVVGGYFVFGNPTSPEAVATMGQGTEMAEKVFPVEAVRVITGNVLQSTELNLSFAPVSSVSVIPKVSGTVDKVFVEVGDLVQKGQVIFSIEKRQSTLQVKQAEAAYEAASANLAQLEKGASEEDLKQAEAGVAQAKASLAGAVKGLENSRKMLEDRTQYKQQLQGAQTQVELAKSQVEAAKSGLVQAKAAYDNAESEYKRTQELFAKEMISRQQLDGVKLQYDSAKTGFESAKERVIQAEIGLKSAQDSLILAEEIYAEPTSIAQQVDAAEAQVEVAKAGLVAAEAQLAKAKKGATVEQLDAARAQVKQAKIALDMAELQLEYTEVTAAISGRVANLSVEEGSMVAPGNPVGVIADLNPMVAKAFVPETYINKLAKGDRVQVTAASMPGMTFSGNIKTISPMADTQTKQFPIEIEINNEDGQLKAGMFGTVVLVTGEARDVLTIPVSSVLYDRGQSMVYKIANGEAVSQEITIELSNEDVAAVKSGLAESDLVITKGQYQVKDGSLVEVK